MMACRGGRKIFTLGSGEQVENPDGYNSDHDLKEKLEETVIDGGPQKTTKIQSWLFWVYH